MPIMETYALTPRQYWEQVRANPNRAKFGFGGCPAIVNIDVQRAYADIDTSRRTAYKTVHRQIECINRLSGMLRSRGLPIVRAYVAHVDSAEDACVLGARTNTPDSLQNIRHGSVRAQLDSRVGVQPGHLALATTPMIDTDRRP